MAAAAVAYAPRGDCFDTDVSNAFDFIARTLPEHYKGYKPTYVLRPEPKLLSSPESQLYYCTYGDTVCDPRQESDYCAFTFCVTNYQANKDRIHTTIDENWKNAFGGAPEVRNGNEGKHWNKFFITPVKPAHNDHFNQILTSAPLRDKDPKCLFFVAHPGTWNDLYVDGGGGNCAARPTLSSMGPVDHCLAQQPPRLLAAAL